MKYKFVIIICLLVFFGIINSSFGQTDYQNYPYDSNKPAFVIPGKGFMEYGVSIGLGASNCSKQQNGDYGVLNAYLSAERYFSNRWGLKVDLTYDRKGWNGLYNNEYKFKLNYLTIPVMANWHFGRTRKWYLGFGPYIGFLLNHNMQEEDFNSIDGGLAFGIGVKLPINPRVKFFIEMDGQDGFANVISKNERPIYSSGVSSSNISRVSLNIGINF